jgi:hypothetical protein
MTPKSDSSLKEIMIRGANYDLKETQILYWITEYGVPVSDMKKMPLPWATVIQMIKTMKAQLPLEQVVKVKMVHQIRNILPIQEEKSETSSNAKTVLAIIKKKEFVPRLLSHSKSRWLTLMYTV